MRGPSTISTLARSLSLPDLTVHDLRIGKHMLDIRFWREGEQTAFEVIKGDPKLVEHRDLPTEGLELRTSSVFI